MKRRTVVGFLAAILVIGLVGCGDKAEGGAASPEDLFKELKALEIDKMAQVLPYIAPDERPLIVFSMDFVGSFTVAFSEDEAAEKDFLKIREKYKLPSEEEQEKEELDLEDMDKMMVFAEKYYGDVDAQGFLTEIEAFLVKLAGEEVAESVKWSEMKDLKVDADKATATIVQDNGNTQQVSFLKVDGKWYLSQKEQF